MKIIARLPQMVLGSALIFTGVGHLTTSRVTFQAQVPTLLKDYADFVVLAWALLSAGAWRTVRV